MGHLGTVGPPFRFNATRTRMGAYMEKGSKVSQLSQHEQPPARASSAITRRRFTSMGGVGLSKQHSQRDAALASPGAVLLQGYGVGLLEHDDGEQGKAT